MPHRLDITRRLHERLLDIVRVGLPLLTSSRADADLAGLAHLRAEMIEAIEAYCRHVHAIADAANDDASRAEAAALVAGCAALRHAYDAFRERWAERASAPHWHEYRLSAVVMMKQVRDHVGRAEAIRDTRLARAA